MKTHLNLLILSIAAFTSNITYSKDIDGEFAVFSTGGETCKSYLLAKKKGGMKFAAYNDWLQGYLSAFNLIIPNTYNILGDREFDEVSKWLAEYCMDNQKESFVNAAAALTVQLFPSRTNLSPKKNNAEKWQDSGSLVKSEAEN